MSVMEDGLTGKETHLAQELARPIGNDYALVNLAMVLNDVNRAFEHDDEVVVDRRRRTATPQR